MVSGSTRREALASSPISSLGFIGSRIRTLETGCEIDVHFVDDTTVEVGLNDYVHAPKKR